MIYDIAIYGFCWSQDFLKLIIPVIYEVLNKLLNLKISKQFPERKIGEKKI